KIPAVKSTLHEEGHEPSSQLNYEALKADVRRQAWISELQRWRDFNEVQFEPHRGVRELKLGLEETARKWLQPDRCSSEEVVRRVTLQKFLSLLPPSVGEKTRKQQPQNIEEAVIMAACFVEDNRAASLQAQHLQLLGFEVALFQIAILLKKNSRSAPLGINDLLVCCPQ
uniref:SCAN box domain-containing protein n=1 Tax=Pygocentrus nattereri TaxID=42514 RepID=A0A3B4DI98_PYGNA